MGAAAGTGGLKRFFWTATALFLALPWPACADPVDSGDWHLIAKNRDGQRTYLDYAFFRNGNPAEFLVKHDNLLCNSKFRFSRCTSVEMYHADCRAGKLSYHRAVMRDAQGNVVKSYENPRAKLAYPVPGGNMETVLIAACKYRKTLPAAVNIPARPLPQPSGSLEPAVDTAQAAPPLAAEAAKADTANPDTVALFGAAAAQSGGAVQDSYVWPPEAAVRMVVLP